MAVKHELDQLYVTNPTDRPFSVHWGGREYTLQAHERKIWVRFLAEHFAKYLTNAILMGREQQHKKNYLAKGGSERDYAPKSYMNSRTMRPEVIDTILTGVYEYHTATATDPNAMIQQQIDQMNPAAQAPNQPREREQDLGEAADPLYGAMQADDPDDDDLDAQDAAGASMIPQAANVPPAPQAAPTAAPAPAEPPTPDGRSMKDLTSEAKKLGITVPFGANKDQVRELIRKQYA